MTYQTDLKGLRSIKRFTVNRSPFVSKKSRDQLEYRVNRAKVTTSYTSEVLHRKSLYFCKASKRTNQVDIKWMERHKYINLNILWQYNGIKFPYSRTFIII